MNFKGCWRLKNNVQIKWQYQSTSAVLAFVFKTFYWNYWAKTLIMSLFLRVCLSGLGEVALSFGTLFSYVEFQILGIVFFSRLITIHLTVHFIEQCPPGFHTLLCFRLMLQMLISLSLPRTRLCCQCGFDPFISHLIPMVVGYKEGKTLNFGKNKKI